MVYLLILFLYSGGRFGIRMTGKLKRLEMQESSPKPKKKKK